MSLEIGQIELKHRYELASLKDKYEAEIAGLQQDIEDIENDKSFNWQEEVMKGIKEILVKEKVKKTMTFTKPESDIAGIDSDLISDTITGIASVMGDRSSQFLSAVAYACKNEPEGSKSIFDAILNQVNTTKNKNAAA